jgi:membrane protease YdiL (CAAX protease family)
MNDSSDAMPALWLRIAQFPLTRLIVLGGVLFMMMAKSNELMAMFATTPLTSIAAAAAMAALAFVVYVAFVRLVERRPARELALSGLGRELGTGILIGAGLYTACVLILMALGIYRIEALNPWSFMLPAVAMALSSAIFEELVFRGVLFRVVEEWVGSWISLALSSVVFGFLHLLNPAATLMGAIFISIEAGLLLAAAYMLTRRLWMSMGFHMSWNYTQSGIFSGIVSGGDADPGLFKSVIQGPLVLTGGSFGLESSLVAFLLCTATGVMLLVMAVRRGHVVPRSGKPPRV